MQYIEQNNCLNDDDLNSLFTLKQRLDEIRESNIILPTIDRFFKKDQFYYLSFILSFKH